jgi:hypothetical protein
MHGQSQDTYTDMKDEGFVGFLVDNRVEIVVQDASVVASGTLPSNRQEILVGCLAVESPSS